MPLKETDDRAPSLGNIKDELFLISFIILASGLIFTDAYYQRFGYRYQLLNLSTTHIIYKGLTMVVNSRFMLIPYLLTIALILFEVYAIKKQMQLFLSLRTPVIYLFIVANLLIIFPLAQKAGNKQALIDINAETSGLPKIRTLVSKEFNIGLTTPEKYVLFLVDGDFVTIFVPLSKENGGAYPVIKRISKSNISLLETSM